MVMYQLNTKLKTNIYELYMMKNKQVLLQSSSTQHTFMQMGIDAPFQAHANPPSCIAVLYAKNDQEIGV